MTELQLNRPHVLEWIAANKSAICGISARSIMLKDGEPDEDLLAAFNAAIASDSWDFEEAQECDHHPFPVVRTAAYRGVQPSFRKSRFRKSPWQHLPTSTTSTCFCNMDHLPLTLRTEAYTVAMNGNSDSIREMLDAGIRNRDFIDMLYIIRECCSDVSNERKEMLAKCLINYFGKSDETYSSIATVSA